MFVFFIRSLSYLVFHPSFLNRFPQAYFAEKRPLNDFWVFLRSAVAMTQFSIFSITPAEHLKESLKKVTNHIKESEELYLSVTYKRSGKGKFKK